MLSPRIPLLILIGRGCGFDRLLNPDTGRPASEGLWTCLILLLFCGIYKAWVCEEFETCRWSLQLFPTAEWPWNTPQRSFATGAT